MILKRVEELKGNEVLAKPLMTWDYHMILPEGAVIKKEYISRIYELGILDVYIKEDEPETQEIVILKAEIENDVKEKVKDILGRHTYHHNKELAELSQTADNIITNILEEEQIVEKVFDIKERSTDIYEHSISICTYAILTALRLGIDKGKIHDIGVGCLLHDIGLRYTTLDFNTSDVNTMNQQELVEYKKHPVLGYSALKDEKWISDLSKLIILQHHERLDGSGFPLRTREIPFECQIVNVCDAFDEMICGITQQQVKVHEAIEFLKTFKKVQFDDKIVDAFLSFTAVYPAGSLVMTNEGETAVVLSQNKEFLDRPVIKVLKDKFGNIIQQEKVLDLVKVHNIFIDKVID